MQKIKRIEFSRREQINAFDCMNFESRIFKILEFSNELGLKGIKLEKIETGKCIESNYEYVDFYVKGNEND